MKTDPLFAADWVSVRSGLLAIAAPAVEELDVLVPKAISGDPFVIAEYVAVYRRLLHNLVSKLPLNLTYAAREVPVALVEQGALNAPFSPWVKVAGPGLGVAIYALSDVRRFAGGGGPDLPKPVAEFPDWNLEDQEIRLFMQTVWKALQQSDHQLQRIADAFGLNLTQLGKLFGVSRQAVSQWFWDEVPASRRAKLATVNQVVDLLRRKLKEDRISGIVRKHAENYDGQSMLDLIEKDRHLDLLDDIRESFDWSATA